MCGVTRKKAWPLTGHPTTHPSRPIPPEQSQSSRGADFIPVQKGAITFCDRLPPRCLCAACLPVAPNPNPRPSPSSASVRPSAHTRRSFEAAPQCHKYRENRFLSLPRHRIGDFGVAGRTDTGRESDLQFDICGEQFMPGHSYSWVFVNSDFALKIQLFGVENVVID